MNEHDDDATRVDPLRGSAAGAQDDATVVKPLHGATAEGTATGTASRGTGESGWRRIADMAQGERIGVGSLLKGRFFMERELGRGGMGVVYLARDERKVEARDRDPYVAVKVLNDDFRKHPDALVALQREARRAQQVANDHIVRVYDFDKDGTNVFMTMEYVEGSDLRALIRGKARDGMPFAEAWPLIAGMGEALGRAHGAGIVHSDFKPGNVMVTSAGVAKVFDFGIARAGKIGAEGGDDRTVFDAGTLGAMTPAYASLEMLQGKPPSPADDIYAFGCVVFELLTGRHPFDKESAEEALAHGRRPPAVPGLDKRQYKALCDAVAFDGARRGSDIGVLLAALRPRRWRERATPWLVAAAVAVALAGGGAWFASAQAERHHVADTLRRLAPGQPDGYRNEDDLRTALAALDGDERRRVVVDGADAIDGFLVRLVATHWDPAKGQFDYPGATRTFALRADLKSFAPKLDRRREEVTHERDDALNRLDTALSQAILGGRLFGDASDDVPAILARIRRIDPASRLLTNPELELKLDMAVGESMAAGDMQTAGQRLAIARRVYPSSTRLAARAIALADATAPAKAASVAGPLAAAPAAASTAAAPDLQHAEHEARLESLRHAAAAGDLPKAVESFQDLRRIDGGAVETDDEAANLLTGAYLDAAREACRAGHWKDAAERIDNALSVIGERDDLRRAQTRYDLAVAVMTAAKAPGVAPAAQDDLRKRLAAVQTTDPQGLKDLEAAMVTSKLLPEGSLSAVIGKMHPVATTPPDPCGRRGLAGSARECFDTFAVGAYGPAMVVIPRSPKPFAMTRTEITIANLDQFCRATRTCAVSRGVAATEPARSIPVAFAQRYAAWLTQVSGHVYRLPTDEEWLLAAHAKGNWDSKDGNCGADSSGLGRLVKAPDFSAHGSANPWGLVDLTGSVWEWTTKGRGVVMRGGSYRSGGDACSVDTVRDSDGTAQRDVGFRLVREIR
ncbi:non-specific serine/threonine protein kinase [Luteibacter sp. UNC138MFCol5.1]|uniref:bifunctional serine/threonine-protein kinase/formylglycine-generating enzyme family protein n=1 Tax=Luteibacter sp. UNC138MFCol5.1 TaxID=1502774 RepID=UPI0008BF7197|nr:bifunctional serine/threonine-protein kinase/formylglycine-generating enzyme family protein [Luteibacter sp. UNC138MFCol5.1]SEO84249.1 non-specific serine/threonine protein kinase [Luteibacter sp. UNC138MFCol5.1]